MFQFLIGIINYKAFGVFYRSDRVSIPYRYYKSSELFFFCFASFWFQFLIGIINPECEFTATEVNVSIPYRYYKSQARLTILKT